MAPDRWNFAISEGCVSRTVRDTARFLDATIGPGVGDPFAVKLPEEPFVQAIERAPRKLRIAVSTISPLNGHTVDEACVAATRHTAELLRQAGHTVERVALPYRDEHLTEVFATIIFGDMAVAIRTLEDYLGRPPRVGEAELTSLLAASLGHQLSAFNYAWAKRRWSLLTRAVGRFHEDYDLVLTPTLGMRPFEIGALQPTASERRQAKLVLKLGLTGLAKRQLLELAKDIYKWMPFTPFANMTGQPSMSLPLYVDGGLPIGTMITGRIGEDVILLQLAAQLEKAFVPCKPALA